MPSTLATDLLRLWSRRGAATATAATAGAIALVCTTLISTPVEAQRFPDQSFGGQRNDAPFTGQRGGRTHEAGRFDYYVMALSWSPTHCATSARADSDPQCSVRRTGKPYSFVLHGVWPQYERGWPQDCQTADRGFVPRPVAQRMLDMMPNERLAFHQYRKHGVCSGLGVERYFEFSRELFNKVRVPEIFQDVTDPRTFVTVDDTLKAFLAANPQMKPDNIAVDCGGPGNRLREVRVCFDKTGNFRSCGQNENQRRMCNAARMYVPPTRSGNDRTPVPRSAPLQPGERRI